MSVEETAQSGRRAGSVGRVLRGGVAVVLAVVLAPAVDSMEATLLPGMVLLFSGLAVLYLALGPALRPLAAVNPWVASTAALIPLVAVYLLLGEPGQLAVLKFLILCLAVAAVRGDGGCEVMSLHGLLFGRRSPLPSVFFSPFDWLEGRVARRRNGDGG